MSGTDICVLDNFSKTRFLKSLLLLLFGFILILFFSQSPVRLFLQFLFFAESLFIISFKNANLINLIISHIIPIQEVGFIIKIIVFIGVNSCFYLQDNNFHCDQVLISPSCNALCFPYSCSLNQLRLYYSEQEYPCQKIFYTRPMTSLNPICQYRLAEYH